MIAYSIIVPVYNEAQSLRILHEEITSVFRKIRKSYEVVYINDGSTDRSLDVLRSLEKKDRHLKIATLRTNFGKSAALAVGFKVARGEILISIDGDLQDDPADIPKLLEAVSHGFDLVCGWRKIRFDSVGKKISSFLFNQGTKLLTGVNLHDVNCGLKVLKNHVADELYIHGELHRFIPVLAAKRKFRVGEVPIHHRPRKFGISKYGIERSWRGIVDLLTTIFLTDYAGKPAHFFGKIGLIFLAAGFIMDAYVSYIRLTTGSTQGRIPLLLAGILFIVLGVQLLSTGLIAEMIIHNNPRRNVGYTLD